MLSDSPAVAKTKSRRFADVSCALANLRLVAAVLAVIVSVAPTHASPKIIYVSPTGSGIACTAAQPCSDIATALSNNGAGSAGADVHLICLDGTSNNTTVFDPTVSGTTIDIDCPNGFTFGFVFGPASTSTTLRVRHLGFKQNFFAASELVFPGSGTAILDDCVFAEAQGAALDIEPNGPLNLVIRNTRISSSGAGMLLKPAVGGSITATFDHVTIADNTGGGIKIDTTNGPVTLDITDSVISNNSGNGINAVGNAGGQAVVSIKNSVIAKNGSAGVQANGANAAILVQTTLFDQNASGATSVVDSGHISTYENNSIVGSSGTGFTGSAPLQ